jgi:hypothetical protein
MLPPLSTPCTDTLWLPSTPGTGTVTHCDSRVAAASARDALQAPAYTVDVTLEASTDVMHTASDTLPRYRGRDIVNDNTGGTVSTVTVTVAYGSGSTLPAASVDRTSNTRTPSDKRDDSAANVDTDTHAPPSRRASIDHGDSASVAFAASDTDVTFTKPPLLLSLANTSVDDGGCRSNTNATSAGAAALPAASTPTTTIEYAASAVMLLRTHGASGVSDTTVSGRPLTRTVAFTAAASVAHTSNAPSLMSRVYIAGTNGNDNTVASHSSPFAYRDGGGPSPAVEAHTPLP